MDDSVRERLTRQRAQRGPRVSSIWSPALRPWLREYYEDLVMAMCRWGRQDEHLVSRWPVSKLQRRWSALKRVMKTEGIMEESA